MKFPKRSRTSSFHGASRSPDFTRPSQGKPRFDKKREDSKSSHKARHGWAASEPEKRLHKKVERTPRSSVVRGKEHAASPGGRTYDKKLRRNGNAPRPSHAAKPAAAAWQNIPREGVLIWGTHAVRAAWLNPKRRCLRLWLTETAAGEFETIRTEARDTLLLKRPDPKKVERQELDRLCPPGSVHQGIVLEMTALPEPSLNDIIAGDAPPDLLIMLDQVTDPHNVGAILRSAAALGAGAVIMTERNAPTTTGVLAKSASGALEHVPQIHVVNLSRALDELQKAGYWCVGLAEEGEKDISALDLTGRTVMVLGAEGEGLRQLTRKKCDELARLPTGGAIGSLNVSNAAAIALYEARRQKKHH